MTRIGFTFVDVYIKNYSYYYNNSDHGRGLMVTVDVELSKIKEVSPSPAPSVKYTLKFKGFPSEIYLKLKGLSLRVYLTEGQGRRSVYTSVASFLPPP